jgi:hypothetical protein
MKKYSAILILICVLAAAPASAVLQNSAIPVSIDVLKGPTVDMVDLVVLSKLLKENNVHDMGVAIHITSQSGSDVDHGTYAYRFDELTDFWVIGREAFISVDWTDTNTAVLIGPTYKVCATIVRFHQDIEVLRGPESCRAFDQ